MPQRTSNKVKVYVRTRPTNNFAGDMLAIGRDGRAISIHRTPSASVVDNNINDWTFHFDGVLHNANQEDIFNNIAKDVVDRTLDGYNGTIMCYGQTGAEISARQDLSFSIRIAYLEIYNDQMCDLLRTVDSQSDYQQQQLSIGEDSGLVYIKGLSYRIANSEEEALNLLFEGETNRAIGQHVLNKQSSRSHCIFTVLIECRSMLSSEEKYTISKLNLVDLAGSERLAKTNSEGVTKREATFINKSLSFLEQAVINLTDKRANSHNFRSSKLTHALKDSIGGRCNTVMIANIWPEIQHLEETVSTLRFASRMMCVPAEPTVNEMIDPIKALENYKRENKMLREELALHDSLINRNGVSYEPLSEQELYEIDIQCRRFLDGSLDDIEVKNLRQVQAIFNTFRNICRTRDRNGDKQNRDRYGYTDKYEYESQNGQKMYGSHQNLSTGGSLADPNGAKNQRVNQESLLKMTRNKQQTGGAATTSKTPGGQHPNTKGTTSTGLQRGTMNDDEQFSRVKEPSDMLETRDQQSGVLAGRQGAFEEFKKTRGANVNKIYLENKEMMTTKKKQFAELARRVNQTKAEIDKTRIDAERKKNERLNMGEFLNENGETIIDEEEYELISKLQELKGIYRTDYDQWKNLKTEITYCQNLVTQCQNRLMQEFDKWYNEYYSNGNTNPGGVDNNYLSSNKMPTTTNNNNNEYRLHDDAAERFERTQKELLLSDLDSTPFRQAQMRANRRQVFDTSTAQSSWKQSPTTTVISNSASYNGRNYDQNPQAYSSLPMNGNRQKPVV